MSESDATRRILLAAHDAGLTLFRTNSGQAWQGVPSWMEGDHGRILILHRPRPIHLLPEGFFDFCGWDQDGRFAGVEIKAARGKVRDKQAAFHAAVKSAGGIAIVAREPADLF